MKSKLNIGIACFVGIALGSCQYIRNAFTFFPESSQAVKYRLPKHVEVREINTSDGETLESFYFKSENDNAPLLIYFHGNAGNAYQRIPSVSQIHELGIHVLLISYRGYGASTGKPNEKGLYLDAEASYNYAINTLGYASEEIILFGRSLGTAVAVNLAQYKEVKGVVLVTPLTSGKDMSKHMGLGAFKFVAGNSLASINKINNLTSPLLIIHGTEDEIVPYYMGDSLYQKYHGAKKMTTIAGAHHNNIQDVGKLEYLNAIASFVGVRENSEAVQ